ncbi:ABC transporter ATP-binding protein [Microbacterium fluvii]|uniref:Spermidine/putrescine import ATP-binding protein PotA n=1 Tax=Microbacterium fluvii TaxID=415215 RepID=A0ABW2HIR1_9MICO|nr:ABC transporter ATP-binding protein [Microbacterium fluvii]MCU4673953.1 ABC transporter ATP-binding protein [Microbacterium fluvii]
MTSAPAIRLTGVTKSFGDAVAVNPLDLEIGTNEFFSILGPSGCGKTTLMRMIAGFETPTDGVIELDGAPVQDVPVRKRDLNMLFQSYALFPHLTVFDNVAFELRSHRVAKAELHTRVTEALELVRLGHLGDRKPSELSGGQRQRVALARAVVGRPAVVLLDEPLGALDLQLRKEMQIELKRMQREVGITFIYVTHDQEEALTMSDRIAVMSAGSVLQVGTPRDIYEHPASRFVAGFIGSCNVFDAVATVGQAAVPGLGPVPATLIGDIPDGTPIGVAIRPERIRITAGAEPGALAGTITEMVYTGDVWRFGVDLGGAAHVVVAVPAVDLDSTLTALSAGSPAWVSWRAEHARGLAA